MPERLREKLLFVDDDPEMHAGIRFILDNDYDLTCVSSGREAIAAAAKEKFPVVILDLQMAELSGLETLKLFPKAGNELQKVIILTGHDTKESAIEALNLEVFRYLLKPFQKSELRDTIRLAFERYNHEKNVILRRNQISLDHLGIHGLTRRQCEIALLAIQGEKNQEIGARLNISERTVEKQMQRIFSSLNVSSRAKLTAKINKIGMA